MISTRYTEEDRVFEAFGQLLITSQESYGLGGSFVWTKDGYFYRNGKSQEVPMVKITPETMIANLGLDDIDFTDILRGFEDEFDDIDLRPYPVFQITDGDSDKVLVATVGELVKYVAVRKSASQEQKQEANKCNFKYTKSFI